jgi:hypothetical protein
MAEVHGKAKFTHPIARKNKRERVRVQQSP